MGANFAQVDEELFLELLFIFGLYSVEDGAVMEIFRHLFQRVIFLMFGDLKEFLF